MDQRSVNRLMLWHKLQFEALEHFCSECEDDPVKYGVPNAVFRRQITAWQAQRPLQAPAELPVDFTDDAEAPQT